MTPVALIDIEIHLSLVTSRSGVRPSPTARRDRRDEGARKPNDRRLRVVRGCWARRPRVHHCAGLASPATSRRRTSRCTGRSGASVGGHGNADRRRQALWPPLAASGGDLCAARVASSRGQARRPSEGRRCQRSGASGRGGPGTCRCRSSFRDRSRGFECHIGSVDGGNPGDAPRSGRFVPRRNGAPSRRRHGGFGSAVLGEHDGGPSHGSWYRGRLAAAAAVLRIPRRSSCGVDQQRLYSASACRRDDGGQSSGGSRSGVARDAAHGSGWLGRDAPGKTGGIHGDGAAVVLRESTENCIGGNPQPITSRSPIVVSSVAVGHR